MVQGRVIRALSGNLRARGQRRLSWTRRGRRALSAVLLRSGVLRSSLHPAPSSPYLSRRLQAGPRLLLPPFPSSRLWLSPTFPPPLQISLFPGNRWKWSFGVKKAAGGGDPLLRLLSPQSLLVQGDSVPLAWFDFQMERKADGGGCKPRWW